MNKSNYLPPIYLEKFVTYENEEYFKDVDLNVEWRGQIQSSTHNKKFRIKFYGDLMTETYTGIKISDTGFIVGDYFSEALIVAEDIESQEQILLFDYCKHGYNAMFCDEYTKEQITNRPLTNIFKDKDGNEVFEIMLSAYYGIDYDDEMEDYLNDDNKIELLSVEIITKEELKRNGFDYFFINVYNEKGEKIEIAEYELA